MTKEKLYTTGVFHTLQALLENTIETQKVHLNDLTSFLAEDRDADAEFRGKIIGLALELNTLMSAQQRLIEKVKELQHDDIS